MRSDSARIAAWLIFAAAFALAVYRAATIPISADEAFTFNRSVLTPIPDLWKAFDANDHVLHTLLCKVSVRWFGESEFALRIPALCGGLLLLWVCRRLSVLVCGAGWAGCGVFALLALHPLMGDYQSMARGYGMATALVLVALDQLMRQDAHPAGSWRLYLSGVSLALAVAANLTAAIPGLGLLAAFAMIHLGTPLVRGERARFRARLDKLLDEVVVPGAVAAVALLALPLMGLKPGLLYIGSSTLYDSAINMAYASLWRPQNLLEHTPLHLGAEGLLKLLAPVVPLLLLGMAAAAALASVRRPSLRNRTRLWMTLLVGNTMAVILLLHAGAGMPYPYRRTGLYLVPLFTLLGASLFLEMPRWWRDTGGVLCAVLIAAYAINWDLRYYDEWLIDAGNRDVMRVVRRLAPVDGGTRSIAATFPLGQSVLYYKRRFGLPWLEAPEGKTIDGRFDIYLLADADRALIGKYGLTVKYRHPLSQVTVAVDGRR